MTEGSRIDPHVERYASRARGMVASETRAMFAFASRPEVVSLAGGMPCVSALPLESLGDMMGDLVATNGPAALQYGSAQGDERLREGICEVMALEQIDARADDVVVTVGSQQALDLVTRLFIDAGDVVLAEAPSYATALSTFAAHEAEVVHVPMDEHGLVPEALRATLARLAAAGRRVKFLYTVPTFQNPGGVTLPPARRAEILDICAEADLLVLEDNPYGLIGFDAEPMRALRADAPDRVIYLGSFSKTLAPGFRVGWALAPAGVRDKLVLAAESAILCHSSLTQLAVGRYLETQPWREQLKEFRVMYRDRRDAMLEALDAHMPAGCHWTRPGGGFFVWLTLPDGLDSKAMLPRAVSERVAYVPGTGFYADGGGAGNIRLSYCFPEPDQIREGVRRLSVAIEQELSLRDTFGPARPTAGDRSDLPGPGLS